MTIDHAHPGSRGLTRRELLKAGGLGLGALAVGRPASAQAPRPGGTLISAQTTEPAGRHAVKFITKEPFAGLLAALGGFWGFIISEAGIKKHGDLNKAALGTGPFMLQDWKVEQQMVLKRHPGYFKKGLPHVDEVNLRIIPDEANIVAALRTGQIHHAFIEDNKNYNLLRDEKTLTGYRSSRLG